MSFDNNDEPFVADKIASGTHPARLTKIKDCVNSYTDKKTGVTTDTDSLRFVFKVEGMKSWICKRVSKSEAENSGYFKLMRMLHGNMLSYIKFKKAGVHNNGYAIDKNAYWNLAQQVEMNLFDVEVEITEYKGEPWINFVSASPATGAGAVPQPGDVVGVMDNTIQPVAAENVLVDDGDDIPW